MTTDHSHNEKYEFQGIPIRRSGHSVLFQLGEREIWIPNKILGGRVLEELTMHQEIEFSLPEWYILDNDLEDEAG
jgi:hypothetical protein